MTDQITPFAVSETNVQHVVIELFGGDNNLSSFISDDMREMQSGAHGPIAMLGLADYQNAGGRVVELSPSKGLRVVEKLGEIDTGDPDTLATFLARAMLTSLTSPIAPWASGTTGQGSSTRTTPTPSSSTRGTSRPDSAA